MLRVWNIIFNIFLALSTIIFDPPFSIQTLFEKRYNHASNHVIEHLLRIKENLKSIENCAVGRFLSKKISLFPHCGFATKYGYIYVFYKKIFHIKRYIYTFYDKKEYTNHIIQVYIYRILMHEYLTCMNFYMRFHSHNGFFEKFYVILLFYIVSRFGNLIFC